MIKVRNLGRLGNNFFQFAFGYAASRELGTDFFMDDMGWFHLFKNRCYWQLKNKLLLQLYNSRPRPEFNWTDNTVPPSIRLSQLQNGVSYRGYFQSETYFLKYEKEIRKIFQFRQPFIKRFDQEFTELRSQERILTINVRGSEYLQFPFSLPASYYEKAYATILESDFKPGLVLVITDDILFAQKILDFIPNKMFIPNRSPEKDFRWLTLSDALIIPNSSFTWWGAWLNERSKITVAPRHWIGWPQKTEDPVGITVPQWKWIDW
ncbi:MAG: alpha-1,2-fucosyltransferase [Verrucomicrobiota bacterium]